MTFVRGTCIAIAAAAALSGCAPGFRHDPPGDLYARLLNASSGMRCTPVGESDREEARSGHIRKRFRAVRPWLTAQIGEAEIARLRAEHDDMMANVDFYGCPGDHYVQWQNMTVRRILGEMERRQRAEARFKPPPDLRTADTAR